MSFPQHEIASMAAERGITPEHEVILYCHRGARSANTAQDLQWAGFAKVRNYIGSWKRMDPPAWGAHYAK
jgi:thiosulfate/3-mercaptopyruvate sulfurtransferase